MHSSSLNAPLEATLQHEIFHGATYKKSIDKVCLQSGIENVLEWNLKQIVVTLSNYTYVFK